jgi:hypothetical protein
MAHVDTLQISGGRKNTALNVFKIWPLILDSVEYGQYSCERSMGS